MSKCVLCGDPVNFDADPEAIYTVNPNTFRYAVMDAYCLRVAYEDLTPERRERYDNLDIIDFGQGTFFSTHRLRK